MNKRRSEVEKRRCICGGDIETILRENAVFFIVGPMADIARHQLPELGGDILVAFLPVGDK